MFTIVCMHFHFIWAIYLLHPNGRNYWQSEWNLNLLNPKVHSKFIICEYQLFIILFYLSV